MRAVGIVCRAGPLQDVRWLPASRRAGVARAGVRAAAVQCCLRLAALTGFEVSVGAFALGSSADGMLNLNAMGTSVMDAETGLSLVEVMVIVWREDG